MELPKNRTEGLRNFVQMALDQLEAGNVSEAKYILTDLINDIGSAYVCKEKKATHCGPVGNYDPTTDGDYSKWLVNNNID